MNSDKAKKAVKKAESRKQEAQAAGALMAASMGLDPEVQSAQADMQPPTVNPYHAMGTVAPTMYSAGNIVPGYNYPTVVNPEE